MEVEVAVVVRATKLAKKRGSRRRQRRGCQVQRRRRARGGTRQFGGVSLGLLLSRAAALAQAATEGGGEEGVEGADSALHFKRGKRLSVGRL